MPDPPGENVLYRFLLENPYPLAVGLLLLGLIVGWIGLQRGQTGLGRAGLLVLVLSVVVLVCGRVTVTPGEHADRVVSELVDAVVQEDLVAAVGHFADDASLHYGQTTSVGHDRDRITNGLSRLAKQYTIENNAVTTQRAYTESGTAAIVHLACRTDAGFGFPAITQWVVRVERRDVEWKVTKLSFISINGQPPRSAW